MTNWNTCPAVERDPREISGAWVTAQAAAWSRKSELRRSSA